MERTYIETPTITEGPANNTKSNIGEKQRKKKKKQKKRKNCTHRYIYLHTQNDSRGKRRDFSFFSFFLVVVLGSPAKWEEQNLIKYANEVHNNGLKMR